MGNYRSNRDLHEEESFVVEIAIAVISVVVTIIQAYDKNEIILEWWIIVFAPLFLKIIKIWLKNRSLCLFVVWISNLVLIALLCCIINSNKCSVVLGNNIANLIMGIFVYIMDYIFYIYGICGVEKVGGDCCSLQNGLYSKLGKTYKKRFAK